MAGSDESVNGCLAILSFCVKKRGRTQREAAESPRQAPILESPPKSSALTLTPELIPALKKPHVDPPVLAPTRFFASTSKIVEDQPASQPTAPNPDHVPTTRDISATSLGLWGEAQRRANDETKDWINKIIPSTTCNLRDPAYEIVELVRRREERHKDEALKLHICGQEILWRDYANRVVSVVTAIGDIAINFAPAPSSTIWSAVKVLLEANVSEREDLVAILGCTDMVLCLVRRGTVYQEVYIGESPRPLVQQNLTEKLIEVYTHCLEFLAFVSKELERGSLRRFLDALLNPGHGEKRVSQIKALEHELQFASHACETKAGDEHRRLLRTLEGPLKRVDDNVVAVLKELQKQEREKAMERISTVRVGAHHNEKRENRTKNTCEWLVNHLEFRKWEDSACSSVLWLQGNIGSGKAFLSSKVIDRYLFADEATIKSGSEHDEGFAFFYCSKSVSEENRRGIHHILRSYIRQLSEVPRRPERVHLASYKLYEKLSQIQNDISVNDCETTLIEIINSYPRTTLVLDGLDECGQDTRRQLAKSFEHLLQKTNRLLKIFIASRPESLNEDDSKPFQAPQILISIDTSNNRSDIEKFVDVELAAFSTLTPETIPDVKRILLRESNGMFRWTFLQLEQLKELRTYSDVCNRLGRLPETLSESYDEIYGKSKNAPSERLMLQRAIRWVACACNPLDSFTLLAAIKVESEMTHGKRALNRSDLTEEVLETVCRHLVVKNPNLGVWEFPHASVAEYFGNKNESWVKNAHAEVTIVLINSMVECCSAFPSVWPPPHVMEDKTVSKVYNWYRSGDVDLDNTLDPRHPFQTYIQLNWLQHVHAISSQNAKAIDVAQALKRFLGDRSPQESSHEYQTFCNYIMSGHWDLYKPMYKMVMPRTNSVFGVVALGLHKVLPGWWDNGLDPSSLVNEGGSDLLTIATHFGHIDLCRDLILRGCRVNRYAERIHQDPLHTSIAERKLEIMKLLLANGADPNRVIEHQSLLCLAIEKGAEYFQMLFEEGADPDIKCSSNSHFESSCRFDCALSAAAYHGNIDALEALIKRGANVNPKDLRDRFGSPLAAAVYVGQLICAKALIARGADVNAHSDWGEFGSPLAAAVCEGDRECARLLVSHGADANATLKFGVYGSPLVAAVSMGHLKCALFLIKHGADVNACLEHGEYGNALAAAIVGPQPSLRMVKLLIEEKNADPAKLAFTRPRRKEGGERKSPRRQREERKIAAYLTEELQVEAQMLISLGLTSLKH